MRTATPHLALVSAGNQNLPAGRVLPDCGAIRKSTTRLGDCEATRESAARISERSLPRVLSLDSSGRILDWIHWQDAACLYVRGAVAWTLGEPCLTVHGGHNRWSGRQSVLDLHPIVAARSAARANAFDPTPTLTNSALFARDENLCLYCGREFPRHALTRDHVLPVSKGGRDIWENVVSACLHCNSHKSNRTPQQARMPLLAVPYRPSWVEHLILSNRNILADQMAFLRHHLPKRPARLS